MNSEGGRLYWSTGIDTSGAEQGRQKLVQLLDAVGKQAEDAGQKMQAALSRVPKISMKIEADTASLDQIKKGLSEVSTVVQLNEKGVAELNSQYQALAKQAGAAFNKGTAEGDAEYRAVLRQQDAIKRLIAARNQAITEAKNQGNTLTELKAKIEDETQAAERSEKAHNSLRSRIHQLQEEAAALRAAAQANGHEIDKTTGRYRQIIEEMGRLKDIRGDIAKASSTFANDENRMAGIISGLSGLSGGFTAVSGAVSLFAGENENLQRVMLKVQSLMSITMGLQQLQQTLNKDSAFSLVTLNKLKEYWNKLLNLGKTAQVAETTATVTATAVTKTDTAVTAANATAKGVLATAWSKLGAVVKRVYAIIKAHPYAAIISAVVAAGVAIYKLVTARSAEEEAQRKANAVIAQAEGAIGREMASLNKLKEKLEQTTKGSAEWRSAKQQLVNQFGQYYAGLDGEIERTGTLATSYDILTKNIRKSMAARAIANEQEKIKETYDDQNELLEDIQNILSGDVYLMNKKKHHVEPRYLTQDTQKKWIEDISRYIAGENVKFSDMEVDFLYRNYTGSLWWASSIADKIEKSRNETLANQKAMYKTAARYGLSETETDDILAGRLAPDKVGITPPEDVDKYKENRKYWENWRQEMQDALNALSSDELGGEMAKKYREAIRYADNEIAKYDISSSKGITPKTARTGQTDNTPKFDAEKWAKEVKESNRAAEIEIADAQVQNMKEGADKQLAQISLNYQKLLIENQKRKADMVEKLREKNPKATEADLPDEQKQLLEAYDLVAYDAMELQTQQVYDSLLGKYQTFTQKRKQIDDDFNADRDAINKSDADNETKLRALAELEQARKKAIQAVNDEEVNEAFRSSKVVASLFDAAAETSATKLRDNIKLAQSLLDYVQGIEADKVQDNFGFTADQLRTLKETPDALKQIEDRMKALSKGLEQSQNPFQQLKKAFEELFGSGEGDDDTDAAEKVKKLAVAFSICAQEVSKTSSQLAGMFEQLGSGAMAGAFSSLSGLTGALAQVAQGFATGGTFGAAMAGVGVVIHGLTSIFSASSRHHKALREVIAATTAQQRQLTLAILDEKLAWEELNTVFGKMEFLQAANAINVAAEAWRKYNQAISGSKHNSQNIAQGLKEIELVTGHKKTGLFGWGKGKDTYSDLLTAYPQIIDAQGKLNVKLVESILSTQKFKDGSKEALQNILDLYNKAEDAFKSAKDYLSSMFGDLGDNISDALSDAFINGSNAAEAFSQSVSKMLAKLAKEMAFQSVFGQALQDANDRMLEIMQKRTLSPEQRFNEYFNVIDELTSTILGSQDEYDNFMQRLQKSLSNKGLDMFQADRQGASKGIAQASQDSVDELNGRMTAVQGHTYSISENTKSMLLTTNAILKSVISIEGHTARLQAMDNNIRGLREAVSDISVKGVKLKS